MQPQQASAAEREATVRKEEALWLAGGVKDISGFLQQGDETLGVLQCCWAAEPEGV